MAWILIYENPINIQIMFWKKLIIMKQIESIADFNADMFIRKHFSNLNENDKMVKAMKSSVKDTIKKAIEAYSMARIK
jgi:hypothetical protein